MTDRELLEAAAKAAGIVTLPELQDQNVAALRVFGGHWNPLTDDGDALRLAVKLRMNLNIYSQGAEADCDTLESTCKEGGSDPLTATRRAIVRAAAALGENKP